MAWQLSGRKSEKEVLALPEAGWSHDMFFSFWIQQDTVVPPAEFKAKLLHIVNDRSNAKNVHAAMDGRWKHR